MFLRSGIGAVIGIVAALGVGGCAATPAQAQVAHGADIKVLVIVDDSDPATPKRDRNVYNRVSTELEHKLSQWGYDMKLESWVAMKMKIHSLGGGRVSKGDLQGYIEAVRLAAKKDESLNIRAVVVYSIFASKVPLTQQLARGVVRIQNRVFDPVTGSFLAHGTDPTVEFKINSECFDDRACRDEELGNEAVPIAAGLGESLRQRLAQLTQGSGLGQVSGDRGSGSGGGRSGKVNSSSSGGGGGRSKFRDSVDNSPVTSYNFRFRDFATRELLQITDVMEKEFPGFVRASAPQGATSDSHYGYTTKAPEGKLAKWMQILLMDMGFAPDRDYVVTRDGTDFLVEKTRLPAQRTEEMSTGRFQ
ncbi:MAG: hypothetical protein ABT940_06960 [Alphaproteobacteria bacterium]